MKKSFYYIGLILFCLALYLPGIATLPMVDRDSANFAQATKQMLETGNYFQIQVQNKARHLKPPGIYWLQAFSVKLTKAKLNAVWPYRLPSVLGALLAVLLTFGLTERILTPKVAALAAALLASTLFLVVESHLVITDSALLTTMVAMQLSLWRIYRNYKLSQPIHWGWLLLFWLAMSLGVVIKGLTPLIALLTIVGLCIVERNIRWLKIIKAQWGIPLLLLLSLAWLIPLSLVGHSNFLMDMISKDLLPKLVGGQESHGRPPGYFAIIFPFMFWPASLFFISALAYAWKNRTDIDVKFWLSWWLPSWLFYEMVPTKLPEYVLPLYPAMAILMALGIFASKEQWLSGKWKIAANAYYLIWGLCSLALIAVLNYVSHYFTGQWLISMVAVSMLFLMAIIASLIFVWRDQLLSAVQVLLLAAVLIFAPIFHNIIPGIKAWWLSDSITAAVQHNLPDRVSNIAPLISLGYDEPSLIFLLGTHRVIFAADVPALLTDLKKYHSHEILAAQSDYQLLQKSLVLKPVQEISGFDYNENGWLHLWLLRVNKI